MMRNKLLYPILGAVIVLVAIGFSFPARITPMPIVTSQQAIQNQAIAEPDTTAVDLQREEQQVVREQQQQGLNAAGARLAEPSEDQAWRREQARMMREAGPEIPQAGNPTGNPKDYPESILQRHPELLQSSPKDLYDRDQQRSVNPTGNPQDYPESVLQRHPELLH